MRTPVAGHVSRGQLGENSPIHALVLRAGHGGHPRGPEGFKYMAPRYGMTVEEFTNLGANPGYPGLMPAEDCGAGFAYAIVDAKDYHGQIADPFSGPMNAGLLNAAQTGASGADALKVTLRGEVEKQGGKEFNRSKDVPDAASMAREVPGDDPPIPGSPPETPRRNHGNSAVPAGSGSRKTFAKQTSMTMEEWAKMLRIGFPSGILWRRRLRARVKVRHFLSAASSHTFFQCSTSSQTLSR